MPRDFDSWSIGWVEAAAAECLRQDTPADRVPMLLRAFTYAELQRWGHYKKDPVFEDIIAIGSLIEPGTQAVRTTPVTFRNGAVPVTADAVPGALKRLVLASNLAREGGEDMIHMWIKQFLEIHPFTDGNGRTAWVLFNWLRDSFDDPLPLPYFEFMPGEKV